MPQTGSVATCASLEALWFMVWDVRRTVWDDRRTDLQNCKLGWLSWEHLTIWGWRQEDATGVGLWHYPWAPARGRGGRGRDLLCNPLCARPAARLVRRRYLKAWAGVRERSHQRRQGSDRQHPTQCPQERHRASPPLA